MGKRWSAMASPSSLTIRRPRAVSTVAATPDDGHGILPIDGQSEVPAYGRWFSPREAKGFPTGWGVYEGPWLWPPPRLSSAP